MVLGCYWSEIVSFYQCISMSLELVCGICSGYLDEGIFFVDNWIKKYLLGLNYTVVIKCFQYVILSVWLLHLQHCTSVWMDCCQRWRLSHSVQVERLWSRAGTFRNHSQKQGQLHVIMNKCVLVSYTKCGQCPLASDSVFLLRKLCQVNPCNCHYSVVVHLKATAYPQPPLWSPWPPAGPAPTPSPPGQRTVAGHDGTLWIRSIKHCQLGRWGGRGGGASGGCLSLWAHGH